MNWKTLIIGVAVTGMACTGGTTQQKQDRDSINLVEVLSRLNKSCPTMIDEETRLEKIEALPKNGIEFFYTIIKRDSTSLDVKAVKPKLEESLIEFAKSDTSMAFARYYRTHLVYSYKDKNGRDFFQIKIAPEQFILK